MDSAQHTQLVNFIWGIADDVLRDVYVKGKYRDVILPMVVIRRLDTVLESTKTKVLETHRRLDEAGIVNQDVALQQAAGHPFYNTSPFTLETLLDSPQQLAPNFRNYLDGIDGFIEREVLPYAPDAWIDTSKTQIGYELSFTRYFYKSVPMRSLGEIRADLLAEILG